MMGRPKLDRGPEQGTSNGLDMGNEEKFGRADIFDLKPCPKCDGKAEQPYKDSHGLYRCNCSVCKFFDVIVSNTPTEAAKKWQEMGGPAQEW